MYTVIGKLTMSETAEYIADSLRPGSQISDVMMGFALSAGLPDGVVVWKDGAYLVSDRKTLKPAPAGARVKTIAGACCELDRREWTQFILDLKKSAREWGVKYANV